MPYMPFEAAFSFYSVCLRGANVTAEATFTLTQETQNIPFEGYGFKLHVPRDCLPAEISETKLNVKVSLSGQFRMPAECELLSAVYWVYTSHKFTKPLTIEIQHCVLLSSDQQCAQLTFVSTKSTQTELPYMFKLQDGGVFSCCSSYGSLSLSHSSGLSIVKRKISQRSCRVQPYPPTPVLTIRDQPRQLASRNTAASDLTQLSTPSVGVAENLEIAQHEKEIFDQYCGQIYTRKEVNDCRVHFVVTKNLDAHRTVSIPIEPTVHSIKFGEIFPRPIFLQFRLWRSSIPRVYLSKKIERWSLDLMGKRFPCLSRGMV